MLCIFKSLINKLIYPGKSLALSQIVQIQINSTTVFLQIIQEGLDIV